MVSSKKVCPSFNIVAFCVIRIQIVTDDMDNKKEEEVGEEVIRSLIHKGNRIKDPGHQVCRRIILSIKWKEVHSGFWTTRENEVVAQVIKIDFFAPSSFSYVSYYLTS